MVGSPPADAGDAGSCPGLGRSHMPRSGWAHEPWPLSLRVRSLCSATGEATAVRGPRTAKQKQKQTEISGVCQKLILKLINNCFKRLILFYLCMYLFIYFYGTRASHCCGLSRCGAQAPDAQAQRPWLTGPAAPRHVGSSQTGAQTCVPCIGRQTLRHQGSPRLILC